MLMLLPLSTMHLVNSTPSIQGVDDHGVLVLRGHKVWVVRPVPSDWNLRPAQVLGDWRESGHQDPQRGLLLSDGGGAKESVVDWRLLHEGVCRGIADEYAMEGSSQCVFRDVG